VQGVRLVMCDIVAALQEFNELSLPDQEEIMQGWIGDVDKPVVSVSCSAYNHEKYIDDALKGFLIQKTKFPFEIVIHDDCSTDKTANIIKKYEKKYPLIIKAIYQEENQYSKGRKPFEFKNKIIIGKYVAVCEGDDFWTDPTKLQKQVDYLESHPEAFITYHSSTAVNHDATKILHKNTVWWRHQKNYTSEQLMKGEGFLPTLTWMYRNIDYPLIRDASLSINGDRMRLVSIGIAGGEGHYVPDIKNAVYRKHDGGVWSQIGKDAQVIEYINTRLILARHFHKEKNNELSNFYMDKIFHHMAENYSFISLVKIFVYVINKKLLRFVKKIVKSLLRY